MKIFLRKCAHCIWLMAVLTVWTSLQAEDFRKTSKITQVVGSVEADPAGGAAHAAKVEEPIVPGDLLKTGADSRAELTAADETVIRVGANSIFSFSDQSRQMILQQGSVLFHTPHGEGGGVIKTAAVTAAVTGSTVAMTTTSNGGAKVAPLESPCTVTGADGRQISRITPGQLLVMMPGSKPFLVAIDLSAFTNSSGLLKGFPTPLSGAVLGKIRENVNKQQRQISYRTNVYLVDTSTLSSPNPIPDPYQVLQRFVSVQQTVPSFNIASLFPSFSPLTPTGPNGVNNAITSANNFSSLSNAAQQYLRAAGLSSTGQYLLANNINAQGVASNAFNGLRGDPDAADLSSVTSNFFAIYSFGNITYSATNPSQEYFSFVNSPDTLFIGAAGTVTIDGHSLTGGDSINLSSDASNFFLSSGSDMNLDNVQIHSTNSAGDGNIGLISGGNLSVNNSSFLTSGVTSLFSSGSLNLSGTNNFSGSVPNSRTLGNVNITSAKDLSVSGNLNFIGFNSGPSNSTYTLSSSANVSVTGTISVTGSSGGALNINAGNTLSMVGVTINPLSGMTSTFSANTIALSNSNLGSYNGGASGLIFHYGNVAQGASGVNFYSSPGGMIIPGQIISGDLNINTATGAGVMANGIQLNSYGNVTTAATLR